MEENKKLDIIKLSDRIYLFDEDHSATGYLVVGDDRAMMIDTMTGEYDLKKYVSSITDKPVEVINTHFHMDHVGGNVYFDKAYIHPLDLPYVEDFLAQPDVIEEIKRLNLTVPPFETVREGDSFDLGGITLKIYDLPGHTPGGIVVLCPEERVLFTGDGINHHLWMQLDCCLSIKDSIPHLERLLFLEKEADFILHGHARGYDDISLLGSMLEGMKEIVAGKTENDLDYNWFGGADRQHPFNVDETKQFDMKSSVIVYKTTNIA